MADDSVVKRYLVGMIIAGIFILAFFILKPIIIAIIFGILFAYIFNPLYKGLNKYLRRKNLSAFLILFGIFLLVMIPIVYLTPPLVKQAFGTYSSLQNYDFSIILNSFLSSEVALAISANLDNILGKMFSTFLNQFTNLLVNLPSFLLQFAVFLFTFFFVIRDTEEIKKYVSSLSPFSKATEAKFLRELRGITNAIVFGQVLIGITQGLALGVGLFILGVPKALVLTFIASLISIIPVLGSWLVWMPVGGFLLVTGQTFQGVFLLLYGALFVSSIDNLIRPYLLSKQSNLPIALSVIGTIGGLYFFGIAGLVLGPLILAYVLIIIEFYQEGKLNELFKK